MKARLIGEISAARFAVEIFDGDRLVWARRWFDNGCFNAVYIAGLCNAFDAMNQCADFAMFEGGEFDDDGKPIVMDTDGTTGVMLEYDTEQGWSRGYCFWLIGQGHEIVDACMAVRLIAADDKHATYADSDEVKAIVKHISLPHKPGRA